MKLISDIMEKIDEYYRLNGDLPEYVYLGKNESKEFDELVNDFCTFMINDDYVSEKGHREISGITILQVESKSHLSVGTPQEV